MTCFFSSAPPARWVATLALSSLLALLLWPFLHGSAHAQCLTRTFGFESAGGLAPPRPPTAGSIPTHFESGSRTCAPGRELSPSTAGHCCWPGQSWSEPRARCAGAPKCPRGWGGDGETCAALDDDPVLRAAERARDDDGASVGLVAGGATLFVVSYLAAIPMGASLLASSPCPDAGIAYTVPLGSLVGAPILQTCNETYSPAFAALGVVLGVAEIASLVLFVVGATARSSPADRVAWRGGGLSLAF